jgi:hypothetical protein
MGRRRWTALVATVAVAVAASAYADLAGACSCLAGEPRERLAGAYAGVVGTVVDARALSSDGLGEYEYALRVERSYGRHLGQTIRLRAGSIGASCGIRLHPGERVAFYLGSAGEPYGVSLCSLTTAAELRRAAAPLPRALGAGRVSFLVAGPFGTARLAALDGRGRVIAYGFGAGRTRSVSACPGGTHAVELVDGRTGQSIAVRRLSDFRVIRTTRVAATTEVHCTSRSGRGVVAFRSSNETPSGSRLYRLSARGSRTLATGRAEQVAFSGTTAFVSEPDRLLAVDLSSGFARTVTRPRFPLNGMAVSPDRGALAGIQYPYPNQDGRWVAAVVDIATGAIRTSRLSLDDTGSMAWLDDRRVIFAPGYPSRVRVFDRGLRLLRSFAGSLPEPVLLHGTLFGAGAGAFARLRAPARRVELHARLPTEAVADLVAVPEGTRVAAADRRRPAPYAGAALALRCSPSGRSSSA